MKNNKLFFALTLLFLGSHFLSAQHYDAPLFLKGEFTLSAGVGVLPNINSRNIHSTLPPLSLNLDYRIAKRATIGAFASYAETSFQSDLPIHAVIPRSSESKQYLFGVRAAAHYDVNKTDFYGGFLLGYNYEETVTNILNPIPNDEVPEKPVFNNGKVIYTAFLGINQRLTNNLGVFGEVGYGISIFKFGLSWTL